RMINQDAVDLYQKTPIGTRVVVLAYPGANVAHIWAPLSARREGDDAICHRARRQSVAQASGKPAKACGELEASGLQVQRAFPGSPWGPSARRGPSARGEPPKNR